MLMTDLYRLLPSLFLFHHLLSEMKEKHKSIQSVRTPLRYTAAITASLPSLRLLPFLIEHEEYFLRIFIKLFFFLDHDGALA